MERPVFLILGHGVGNNHKGVGGDFTMIEWQSLGNTTEISFEVKRILAGVIDRNYTITYNQIRLD